MSYGSGVFESTQVWLEIDEPSRTAAWQSSRALGNAASQWNGYLNRLCVQAVQSWLQEDYGASAAVPNAAALPSFWELVNGTATALAGRRLILIPSEAIDADELRVPQEWVDIPNWLGDYYLAVQVNEDEGWVRLNGFATHRQLKQQGHYDWRDRTYSLADSELIADFGVLWVSQQLAPQEVTRVTVPDLAALPIAQAKNLIERLSHPSLINPRLAIPFATWGALVGHGGWRQRLAERRQGLPEQRSLLQWLQSGISDLAQQAGWGQVAFQPSAAGARGDQLDADAGGIALSRRLEIAEQPYELLITPADGAGRVWRFTLRSLVTGGSIPAGFVLRLLTEDLQSFEGNEDRAEAAIDSLFIEVALEPDEGVVWEIEPTPEGYDREILNLAGLP
ncbi:MAG: DUF1822 family protein [Oscillatoriophycideae cyanobacterium NC_groundwater_1537_Pr4_S-0.65um_50_18]|nr:DUF1822 family protein [Oscillatoriophycideae cyanobacterium NC_groundwater_1537_Pr4_S-0.65um_50_18]